MCDEYSGRWSENQGNPCFSALFRLSCRNSRSPTFDTSASNIPDDPLWLRALVCCDSSRATSGRRRSRCTASRHDPVRVLPANLPSDRSPVLPPFWRTLRRLYPVFVALFWVSDRSPPLSADQVDRRSDGTAAALAHFGRTSDAGRRCRWILGSS